MKRMTSILTGLSLAVLFSVATAPAQSGGQEITANIPFEFTAGNISFPAGQYRFIRSGPGLFLIRDADGRGQMVLAGAPVQQNGAPEQSNLKFASVNGRHVLVQIWSDVADSGNDFPESAKHLDGIVTNKR